MKRSGLPQRPLRRNRFVLFVLVRFVLVLFVLVLSASGTRTRTRRIFFEYEYEEALRDGATATSP